MKELDINIFTPHSTRHSFISLLHSVGADPINIKKIVGHSTNDVTGNVYIHPNVKELYETINMID